MRLNDENWRIKTQADLYLVNRHLKDALKSNTILFLSMPWFSRINVPIFKTDKNRQNSKSYNTKCVFFDPIRGKMKIHLIHSFLFKPNLFKHDNKHITWKNSVRKLTLWSKNFANAGLGIFSFGFWYSI